MGSASLGLPLLGMQRGRGGTARTYLQFARISFLRYLAYRAQVAMAIVVYGVLVAVSTYLWRAVFAHRPLVAGYTAEGLITYVTMGWVLRSWVVSGYDREIGNKVREGTIAMDLVKPVDFQLMHYATSAGRSAIRVLFLSLPVVTMAHLAFGVRLPDAAWRGVLFAAAAVLAFFIYAGLNYLVGVAAFWTQNYQGLSSLKEFLVIALSGQLIPYHFIPVWCRTVLHLLPFEALATVPLGIYVGFLSPVQAAWGLLRGIIWALSIFALGRAMWNRAIATLDIQGG